MHLVFLNQYYPPDAAPTGVMLEGLVQGLADAGHEVTVLCAAGGYAGGREKKVISDQLSVIRDCEGELTHGVQALSASSDLLSPIPDLPSPIHIHRIRASRCGRESFIGKLLDYLLYYLGTGWKLLTLRPRPDRIVALTTPPYLSVLARLVSKVRGADHAHWVMDLYPDVMAAHGMLAETGLAYRILTKLTRLGLGGKRCAAVVTLGPDMAERVEKYAVMPVPWVPLWGAEEVINDGKGRADRPRSADLSPAGLDDHDPAISPVHDPRSSIHDLQSSISALAMRRQRGWGDDELVVMYSGNMGLGHRFNEILAAAKELAASSILDPQSSIPALRIVFYGGGKRREEVAKFIDENPGCAVELHDYAPAELLTTHLQSADVHLASLDAAWTGTMVPSKVQGIFGAGRPVIFIGSAESSIGRWVLDSGGGWVRQPDDVAGLLAALADARNPAVRMTRGRAAKSFAEAHFKKATNVARLTELLASPPTR